MSFTLFDYIDRRGDNDFAIWTRNLPKRERAILNQKLDMLATSGADLGPKLLSDTPSPKIKKIRINGTTALRPMLCKGPIDNDREFTLLLGASERDRKFFPPNALAEAESRRSEVIANPTRRCMHERIPP